MVVIESRHIMDEIRSSCPLVISFSLNRIVLNYSSSDKHFGFARFEGIDSEKEQEVTCAWWINIMPEMSELVIHWIGSEESCYIDL